MGKVNIVYSEISSVVTVGGVEIKREDAFGHLPVYIQTKKKGIRQVCCPSEAVELIENPDLRQYFTDIFILLEGEEWVYE